MARTWWHLAGPTRTLPVAATAGVPIVLAPPHKAGHGWAMARAKATAAVAAAATTLTLATTAGYNNAEAWTTLRGTADRLRGTSFRHKGQVYRITDHSGVAVITFTPALEVEILANEGIDIQSDLPPLISYLLLVTTGVALQWAQSADDTPVEAEMADLANNLSEVIHDDNTGTRARKTQIVGSAAAGTVQVRCFAA